MLFLCFGEAAGPGVSRKIGKFQGLGPVALVDDSGCGGWRWADDDAGFVCVVIIKPSSAAESGESFLGRAW